MKIKEGGVMDILEIQEKFEDLLLANPDFDESLLGKDEEGCYSDSDIQHMYSMFEAGTEVREQWQSAKAQADQKVKLLLCDEHLKKCESPTGIFNSQYPDEEPCLICLAKEAKAQAVPKKTVQLHLVWNENKDECVGFLDSKDARYTATGDDRGMFGVTALGDYFRDLNDERDEFESQIVMIEAQEPAND